MTPEIIIEDTPTPSESLLSLLKSHLPHSLPVLRRLQFSLNFSGGRTPHTHVLYAHYPGDDVDDTNSHFAAACVDLSRGPETQLWIYSSLERTVNNSSSSSNEFSMADTTGGDHPIQNQIEKREEKELENRAAPLILALLRRIRTIASTSMGNNNSHTNVTTKNAAREEDDNEHRILVGSLHETVRQALLARGVKMYKAPAVGPELDWEFCGKWLFRVEGLPSSSPFPDSTGAGTGLPEGMRWDRVRKEDVGVVLARTSIKRTEATLLMLPSTVVRLEDGTPVAWAFMGLDGTIITLHVEVGAMARLRRRLLLTSIQEAYRQRGLAKALACKLMREHIRDYGDDGWGAADVFEGNYKSQALCRSIGGKNSWTHSWAMLDISSVGKPV